MGECGKCLWNKSAVFCSSSEPAWQPGPVSPSPKGCFGCRQWDGGIVADVASYCPAFLPRSLWFLPGMCFDSVRWRWGGAACVGNGHTQGVSAAVRRPHPTQAPSQETWDDVGFVWADLRSPRGLLAQGWEMRRYKLPWPKLQFLRTYSLRTCIHTSIKVHDFIHPWQWRAVDAALLPTGLVVICVS